MKTFVAILGTAGLLAMMTACSGTSAASSDSDVNAIKTLEAQWNKDFEGKDPEKLAAHYADDAVLMTPGMASVSGREAVKSLMKAMVADPALSLKFSASRVEVGKGGDLAYSQGMYTMTMTDPATKKVINDKGDYVTVYKKQSDGNWRAVSDIATSNTPMHGPTAAQ